MEPLIALPYDTIIYTISLCQCWQQQVLSTDFQPRWKVLSTVGHLPTEKIPTYKELQAIYRTQFKYILFNKNITQNGTLNLLAPELFFSILAHLYIKFE